MRGCWVAIGLLGALVAVSAASSCVDSSAGEVGTYGSPCSTSFGELLRCGRESGGADPNDQGGQDQDQFEDDCAEICALLCDCGLCEDPGDESACTADCRAEPLPPDIVECIKQQGCQFDVCFGNF